MKPQVPDGNLMDKSWPLKVKFSKKEVLRENVEITDRKIMTALKPP
jgi:hypothetical protein